MKYEFTDEAVLEIHQDDSPDSPREWDNITHMFCFHKRYSLGDKHDHKSDEFNGWEGFEEHLEKEHDAAVILPLYLYDHSGITMNTTGLHCSWDSGQVGFIFMTKEDILKAGWGKGSRLTATKKRKAKECMVSDVKVYDQYLTGDVYGFQLTKKATPKPDIPEEHVDDSIDDSCWGFYGDDPLENGMADHLPEKYRKALKSHLKGEKGDTEIQVKVA